MAVRTMDTRLLLSALLDSVVPVNMFEKSWPVTHIDTKKV